MPRPGIRSPNHGCLINTARLEVVDEAGLTEALLARPDLGYTSDVQLVDATALKEKLGVKFAKQVRFTPKEMGAQTAEANSAQVRPPGRPRISSPIGMCHLR